MQTHAEIKLDRKKFRSNVSYLRSKSQSSFFCPMVKANAYGVGDIQVVRELLEVGVTSFGVARIDEGLKLRRFFPEKKFQILVFHPVLKEHIEFYDKSDLTPVICSFRELKVLLSESLRMPIHIKFDLGMTRFGFNVADALEIAKTVKEAGVVVEGVCGHFSQGDDWAEKESVSKQRLSTLFELKEKHFPGVQIIHAPNSDAILQEKSEHGVGLRPGLAMYYSSLKGALIKNAVSLSAPVVEVRNIKRGEGVSYGSKWRASQDSKIAILPIGYADGLSRGLSGKISVNFGNKSFPLVGAICMDYCMVNIGLNSKITVGDSVEFFGENMVNLKTWAEILGTIPYEIITGLGLRLKRRVG